MICPKCGFEQPESPECMRCGVVISRYKGTGPSATPAQPFAGPPPLPSGHETVRLALDPQPPPLPAPPPFDPPPGGGTVYQGPDAGTAAAEAMRQGPSFSSLQANLRMATRRLGVGEVLSETFSIFFRNLIPFSILTALAFSPIFVLGGVLAQAGKGISGNAVATGALLFGAGLILCLPLATAAITYGVFQQMRGEDSSLGSCLRVGLSCMLPVLSVAILQMLVVLGAILVTAVPVGIIAGLVGKSSPGCAMVIVPLVLLCYVPAVMLMMRFFVAIPAAVEERPGPLDALKRSSFLTEGERGRIFGILFLLVLINAGISLVAVFVPRVGFVLQPLVSLLMTGVFATACAVIYYRLRSLKESIDVDQIASVFS
jgi:hypothetical protein